MALVVEFRVLGPVEAVVDGRSVPLPAAKPRALLAVLLLSRNRVVPVAELIQDLWSDEPPETATKALQVYVSQLRKAIGSDRVLTKAPGYSLLVGEGELDLDVFEALVREGASDLPRATRRRRPSCSGRRSSSGAAPHWRSSAPSRSPAMPGRVSRRRSSRPWKIGSTPTSPWAGTTA